MVFAYKNECSDRKIDVYENPEIVMAFPSEQQLSAPLKLLHCDATTKKCSDDDCDGCVADELCFELVESATRDKSQDGVFSIV